MALPDSKPNIPDNLFHSEDVAQGIIAKIDENSELRVINYLHALSKEWKGHPGLEKHKLGIGRLSFEVALSLDQGEFYCDDGPTFIDHNKIYPILADFMPETFTPSDEEIDDILKALGNTVVNHPEKVGHPVIT